MPVVVSHARRHILRAWPVLVAGALVAGCATAPLPEGPAPAPAQPPAAKPGPAPPTAPPTPAATERGKISRYGAAHAGKPTASGAPFDPEALTMAHRTLPFGTRVRVTSLATHQSVEVVVNDRGPFVADRIADVSAAAARKLGMTTDGVVDATLEVIAPAR
ncbi:MAG: septal ring lytic transglycosylase RlpA family protein [Burkholderiales bacterium]